MSRFFEPKLPAVACEISRQAISLVRLDAKQLRVIERFGVVPLPAGLVIPSLTKPNLSSVSDLATALKSALAKIDQKPMRMSLAIPDASAKSTIHVLDKLPSSESEKQQLLRWKLKKTVPFNVDEAQLSYWERKMEDGKHALLTVCINREVLSQYEEVFQRLGIHAGYVTLSSFAAFELLAHLDSEVTQKSVLLLRSGATSVSSLIMQEGRISFFRHAEREEHEDPASVPSTSKPGKPLFQELYDELYPCVIYFQDKLSAKPLSKIYVACSQEAPASVFSSLSEALKSPVEALDLTKYFHSPLHMELKTHRPHLLSPLGLAVGRD